VLKDAQGLGKIVLTASVSTIPGVITVLVYLILIPMLVFFFLKDDFSITLLPILIRPLRPLEMPPSGAAGHPTLILIAQTQEALG
ncbi:MAG: hypothetical protein R3261_14510, partial [Alphaproteobacteria bacterium]|nr:hypothetical protein [Alphaproteobacteria bacterium]